MEIIKNTSRNQGVDTMRVIAIIAVVIIHTQPFTGQHIHIGQDFNLGYFLNQLARFSVPFFFVISGYFWAGKLQQGFSVFEVTTKMAKRIGIIFLAWSVIYLLPTNLGESFQYGALGPLKTIYLNAGELAAHPLASILDGSKAHLWFLTGLISSLAISAVFIYCSLEKALIGLSVLLYAIGLAGKAYADTPIGFHVDFNFRDGPFFGLIFFVSGYVLKKTPPAKSWLGWGIVVTLFGVVLHFAELFALRHFWGGKMLQDYVLGTYFMGVGVALIALSEPQFLKSELLSKIAPLVLGVYVIHFVFVDLMHPIAQVVGSTIWWSVAYPSSVLILSFLSTHLLSRVRFLKAIIV